MSPAAKSTAYPIRALRYWWVGQALSRELCHKPDAVIVDMGAGDGQARHYCAGSQSFARLHDPLRPRHWVALDRARHERLLAAGYAETLECDFDRPLPLESGSVDALICIHVMEHLRRPEFALAEIARVLVRGGVFLGGSPVAPGLVSFFLHHRLRHKMRNGISGFNGHVNSFSPGDWKKLVAGAGLKLDFLSGSHLMRHSGAAFENSKTWARMNLFWGGMFPSLGSEVYLLARKEG